jgi:hypothetical protein
MITGGAGRGEISLEKRPVGCRILKEKIKFYD